MSSLPAERRGGWQWRGRGAVEGRWGGVKQTSEGCAHTNTPRQSQISRKGLRIDWLDSRAAITYQSNSREIRTVGGLMATLPPAPSPWQCQPMSRRRLVPPFKFDTIKISRYFLLLCLLLFFSVLESDHKFIWSCSLASAYTEKSFCHFVLLHNCATHRACTQVSLPIMPLQLMQHTKRHHPIRTRQELLGENYFTFIF